MKNIKLFAKADFEQVQDKINSFIDKFLEYSHINVAEQILDHVWEKYKFYERIKNLAKIYYEDNKFDLTQNYYDIYDVEREITDFYKTKLRGRIKGKLSVKNENLKKYINKLLNETIEKDDLYVLNDWLIEQGFQQITGEERSNFDETSFKKEYGNFLITLHLGFDLETGHYADRVTPEGDFQEESPVMFLIKKEIDKTGHLGNFLWKSKQFDKSRDNFQSLFNGIKETIKQFEELMKTEKQDNRMLKPVKNFGLNEAYESKMNMNDYIVLYDWLMDQGFSLKGINSREFPEDILTKKINGFEMNIYTGFSLKEKEILHGGMSFELNKIEELFDRNIAINFVNPYRNNLSEAMSKIKEILEEFDGRIEGIKMHEKFSS